MRIASSSSFVITSPEFVFTNSTSPARGEVIVAKSRRLNKPPALFNYHYSADESVVGSLTVKAIRLSVGLNFKIYVIILSPTCKMFPFWF